MKQLDTVFMCTCVTLCVCVCVVRLGVGYTHIKQFNAAAAKVSLFRKKFALAFHTLTHTHRHIFEYPVNLHKQLTSRIF